MTAILVTLIFLLADGTPAKKATVYCSGVAVFESGSDFEEYAGKTGGYLIVDSRGAAIVSVDPAPQTIACWARFENQAWRGDVVLKQRGVLRFQLQHAIDTGEES